MFGYTITKKKYLHSLEVENEGLRKENELFLSTMKTRTEEVESLRSMVSEFRKREDLYDPIDVDVSDPVPDKSQERKEYVARIAGFYTDILKKKLVHMISNFHKALEEETNNRDGDFVLKAGVYVCREFMLWGQNMIKEQIGYQVEAQEEAEEETLKPPVDTSEMKMQINSVLNQNQ